MNKQENLMMAKHSWQAAETGRLLNVEPTQELRNRLNERAQQLGRDFPQAVVCARAIKANAGEHPWSLGIRMVGAMIANAEKEIANAE